MEYVKYLPLGLLSAFIGKLLIFGSKLSEMGVVFALVGLVALKEYLDKHKTMQQIEVQVSLKLEEINEVVKKQNQVIELMSVKLADHRSEVSGLKLAQGMKTRVGS